MMAIARTSMNGSGTALFDLLGSGAALERYPEVQALLAGVPPEALTRAGRMLSRLDPQEIHRRHPGVPVATVAITGHGTLNDLVPELTVQLARHGIALRPHLTAFDSYVFELSDPASGLYAADPGVVLCVLDPDVVGDELPCPWTVADVERCLAAKLAILERLVEVFEANCAGTLVLNTVPLPRRLVSQLVDYRSRARLSAAWRDANAGLLRMMQAHPRLVVLDLDPLASEGVPVADDRLRTYTNINLSPALLAAYAREAGHLVRGAMARIKKVLVLDLDDTVWGGVLGDDGPDGIEVAGTYRGEAFAAFQRVVKQLGSQGVLLAAASKNEPGAVAGVFGGHPDMVLREADLAEVRANWRPKPDNLRELAAALNLGVDSLVFVDDSPFECDLMRRALPGVAVVQVDDEPALHVDKLLRDGWFDTREVTAEDRIRTTTYRQERDRSDFLQRFDSVQDYLRALGLRVQIGPVRAADAARVSQLTLRTNQFNLTRLRMQQHDVETFAGVAGSAVLAIRSADRFGESGIVGAAFVRADGADLRVENFVLSCRVFSRGIEQAALAAVFDLARVRGLRSVVGLYRANAKNAVVADLYPLHGFRPVAADGAEQVFRRDAADGLEPPAHIRLTVDLEGLPLS
ncbi:HAD-IIIC family phosphatase [Dactylosporangium sp. NPDC048998]|uniref:HAD-IIIC family phosphatase n=1 Tax=Dactylosporangium sp. NPDC048998 TaxID=3363976 RepID=UPI003722FC49